MTTVLAWHFLTNDCRTGEGGILVHKGQRLHVDPPVTLCKRGLHGSRRAIDALVYAPGPIVERVELSGEVLHDTDKLVAADRLCLWWADATAVLHEFACRCAEDALALVDSPDPRSVAAIRVRRAWLRGEATDEELSAARAASAAARAAAWYAANAAWYAAWYAASAAARAAVWSARADAEEHQNRRLTAMLSTLKKEGE